MIFNRYPYTDFHEMNLDMLLEVIKKLTGEMEDFKVINKITFYGEWDITNQYPAWAIVDDNGNGYISIKPVPAGVPLSDGNYWVLVADYSALYANITTRIVALENTVGDNNSGLVKDVNDLKATVGDNSSGLVKAVNDLDDRVDVLEYKILGGITIAVSDSYGTESDTSWMEFMRQYLGIANDKFYQRTSEKLFRMHFLMVRVSYLSMIFQTYPIKFAPHFPRKHLQKHQ